MNNAQPSNGTNDAGKPKSAETGRQHWSIRPGQRPRRSGRTITVPLTIELELYAEIMAMGRYDGHADLSEAVSHCLDGEIDAWLESPDRRGPAAALRRWLKKHPPTQIAEAAPGRITVALDDLASAMLEKTCREGNGCREAGEDPRDLVNAAVTFYLCDDANCRHRELDLECGDDSLQRAKADRLAQEGGAR